jgi:NAD(P)-dependent dehydrogenase (short-subunit alcohol dehydrogenase family)
MELESGQVAVITGGGSGIGLALARQFARRGLNVMIADIDGEALQQAEGELETIGVRVQSAEIDVTSQSDQMKLAETTLSSLGRIDVVCNNAGTIGKNMPIWEFEHVEWEWLLGVDLWGVINGIRAFVPHLVAQDRGYVVNTASMAGLSMVPLNGPYNAAKHAVVSLSETLWADFQAGQHNVGVTVVCPGPTLTRLMTEGGRSRPQHLMPQDSRGVAPHLNPGTFAGSTNSIFSADQVAQVTLEAIGRDQLYVAPHPQAIERVDRRVNRIRADVMSITVAPEESKTEHLEV